MLSRFSRFGWVTFNIVMPRSEPQTLPEPQVFTDTCPDVAPSPTRRKILEFVYRLFRKYMNFCSTQPRMHLAEKRNDSTVRFGGLIHSAG